MKTTHPESVLWLRSKVVSPVNPPWYLSDGCTFGIVPETLVFDKVNCRRLSCHQKDGTFPLMPMLLACKLSRVKRDPKEGGIVPGYAADEFKFICILKIE